MPSSVNAASNLGDVWHAQVALTADGGSMTVLNGTWRLSLHVHDPQIQAPFVVDVNAKITGGCVHSALRVLTPSLNGNTMKLLVLYVPHPQLHPGSVCGGRHRKEN